MLSNILRTSVLCLTLAVISAPNYSFAIRQQIQIDDGSEIEEPNRFPSTFDNIRSFDRKGSKIPMGSKCESILHEAESRLGRPLTKDEIEANLDAILKATGESLKAPPLPGSIPHSPRSFCFPANMKVATPTGERLMGDLKVGDEVVSIDLKTKQPVVNRVFKIMSYADRKYGRLQDLPRPIDVTERHRFYTQAEGGRPKFAPIENIPAEDNLFSVDLNTDAPNVLTPIPRGCYLPQEGTTTVYDLQMEGHPRNFIVEGILVHNIREKF